MTVFFALWPPAPVARALHAWAEGLRGQSKARLTREESLHMTLVYIGRVPEADLDRLVEAGARAHLQSHTLTLDHAEYWAHNNILWAGPTGTPPPLVRLVDTLRGALREAGFSVERRAFHPHLTLLRKAAAPSDGSIFAPLSWPVEEFVLARSDQSLTSRPGSPPSTRTDYHVVERFAAREDDDE